MEDKNTKERKDILDKYSDIIKWIQEKRSYAYMCKELHCKYETLKRYLLKMNISYQGNQGLKGARRDKSYVTACDYSKRDCVNSNKLRLKLIKEKIKEEKCERCGLTEWQGYKIPLELHHKNGNHNDNDFDNLEILCPNCHALENNKGKRPILSKSHIVRNNMCQFCGLSLNKSKSGICKKCSSKIRAEKNSKKPNRECLKNDIYNMPFVKIGKKYGVSDNTIRKWCKYYNLPHKVSDIKQYSNKEWNSL